MHSAGRSATLTVTTRAFNSSTVGSLLLPSAYGARSAPNTRPRAVTRRNRKLTIPSPFGRRSISSALFLRLNGDQPVFRLPLLIRILPVGRVKEEVIIFRRLLQVVQVIVGGRPQKIGDGNFRQQFDARIERSDHQRIILVLARRKPQIAVSLCEVGLQLDRVQELLLRIR